MELQNKYYSICTCTGLSACSELKKVAFWPIWRRPVLRAGGCFRGEVFADVLLFSSGFGSYRCHDLFGTNFDHMNTVLLMTKYDPDSLSPSFLSLFFRRTPSRRGHSNCVLMASNGQVSKLLLQSSKAVFPVANLSLILARCCSGTPDSL